MENNPSPKKLRGDIILIGAVLALALVLYLVFALTGKRGTYATVRVNNEVVARYPLDEDGTYVLNGGTNTLVIEDGTARITEASCPDGICISQGRISTTDGVITCLPNRLTVTVSE